MSIETYYDVLGITPNASFDEIKKTYRKLSLKFHPDRNGNCDVSKQTFQNINDAYTKILQHRQTTPPSVREEHAVNMQDVMNILKKNTPQEEPYPTLPTALYVTVYISLEQSYTGCMLPVEIERWIIEGHAKRNEKETIYIDFCKGIDANETITYPNKGHCLNQTYSDVKIIVQIIKHECFTRDGLDLIYTKTITLKQALCGVVFQLEHVSGKKYNIQGDTIITPHFKKVIRGLGLPRGGHYGNLIIKFNIEFPETLSNEQVQQIRNCL